MRISPTFSAVVLCAVTALTAQAQQPVTPGANRNPAPVSKLPQGMGFAFDSQTNAVTASGVRMKATTQKSNSVSPTEGVLVVTININVASHFEAGTTYHCSVYAIGGIIDIDTGTVDGGLENANNFATASNGKYSCTLRIPYAWTLPSSAGADSGLILAFGVAAVNTHSEVQRSTLQVDGIENLPANGATSKFTFNVAL